ncbi:hypothetical protein EYZ11_011496 [Aspergillus tanneri]|uniref:Uncharacterized protein n=1 Tax=Aspergillus tanneri TaxID=1220188 RepID=A0A4S3J2P9_9EURO|nr:hypothetical protein EYZ11_011496 [Aspergillus tanneri]
MLRKRSSTGKGLAKADNSLYDERSSPAFHDSNSSIQRVN